MFYSFVDSSIFVTNMDDIRIQQEKDPVTQTYFETRERAMEWAKGYLVQVFGYESFIEMSARLTTTNVTKEIDKMTVGTRCRIHLDEESGALQDEAYIEIIHADSKERTELEFFFEDGKASVSFLPKKTGEYILLANGPFLVNDIPSHTFEDVKKFSFIAE